MQGRNEQRATTIGGLARASGVKVTTIRYYESIGLIDPPERSEGGQRLYDRNAVERMNFIRHARDLGFSLEAIRELIALASNKDRSCAEIDEIARRHAADIRHRIRRLKALEREMERMIKACAVDKVADCRVLAVLADHHLCATPDHGRKEESVRARRR
ncbi:MAG: helix-turn-helix domain-containing protein [Parvularculaceae bacterium]